MSSASPQPVIEMLPGSYVVLHAPRPEPAPGGRPAPLQLLPPFTVLYTGREPVDVVDGASPTAKLVMRLTAERRLDVVDVRGGWWCVWRSPAGTRELWMRAPLLAVTT